VLEQRLGELAGGLQLVPDLGERDRATMALGHGEDPPLGLGQRLGVVMEALGDPDRAAGVAERSQVPRGEL
jgi:hypothetical protein